MGEKLLPKADQRKHKDILSPERLELVRELMGIRAGIDRKKLKEELDSQSVIKTETYDLGIGETENKDVEEIRKLSPEFLIGSVDSTRFAMKWHEPKWYKPFVEAAAEVMKLQELFDEPTKEWMKELLPALEAFQELSKYDTKKYNHEVKREIWKLVKEHGEKIIYGEKGLFNFLLAFRRVKNLDPTLDLADDETFNFEDFKVKKIKLVLGSGKGKEGGKDDRFAYAAMRKKQKKSEGTVEKKEEPKEDGKKNPIFLSEDFFGYYEIDDTDDFKTDIGVFDEFWNKYHDDLFNDESMKKKYSESSELFDDDTGEFGKLYLQLSNFKDLYENFWKDQTSKKSVKYQNLYFQLGKRMIEYANTLEDGPEKDQLLARRYQQFLEGCKYLGKNKDFKEPVLKQVKTAKEFATKKDLMGLSEWQDLFKGYE